jgi:hypothetical protein
MVLMSKPRIAMLLVTAILVIHGIKEVVLAIRDAGPVRDGLHALVIGSVTFLAYLLFTKSERR